MSSPPESLPGSRLVRLDENLLIVTADGAPPTRRSLRMTVVRLADSRLVLFGAVPLGAAEVRALARFGTPAYLIVPSTSYRQSVKRLKELYPELLLIAPKGLRHELEPDVKVDDSSIEFGETAVCFVTVPGTDGVEAALLVETAGGVTLVVDDLLLKLNEQAGNDGWGEEADGGDSRKSALPAPPFLKTAKDRESLRAQLLAWSQMTGLNRIIVSRGAILTEDATHALIAVAATLAA